jgi:hypothetical protein
VVEVVKVLIIIRHQGFRFDEEQYCMHRISKFVDVDFNVPWFRHWRRKYHIQYFLKYSAEGSVQVQNVAYSFF